MQHEEIQQLRQFIAKERRATIASVAEQRTADTAAGLDPELVDRLAFTLTNVKMARILDIVECQLRTMGGAE